MGSRIVSFAFVGPREAPTHVEVHLIDDDGEERTEVLNDLVEVRPWGLGGVIFRFRDRDAVMVRPDLTVHPLVTA